MKGPGYPEYNTDEDISEGVSELHYLAALVSWMALQVLSRAPMRFASNILVALMDFSGTSMSLPLFPDSYVAKFNHRNVTNAVTGALLSTFSHASGPMTG